MTAAKTFRFAVQTFSATSAKEWRERAQRVEALGYSALHLADHIIGPGPAIEASHHPIQELAAVPAMAVAAEATSSLRVGCRVFCIDYRRPAVLAKEVATLDLLSEGRLEVGLGAGWLRAEYDAIGLDFDPAPVRIDRLSETLDLIQAHMGDGLIDFEGDHVRAHDFEGAPKSVQKPTPPIMIGGGSARVLKLAGRRADIVSLNFNNRSGMIGPDGVQLSTPEQTERKLAWIREGARERFDALELEIGAYFTFVTDHADQTAEGLGKAFGLGKDEMLAFPHALIGSPDSICDELQRRRDRYGISYVTVPDNVIEDFAPVVAKLAGS